MKRKSQSNTSFVVQDVHVSITKNSQVSIKVLRQKKNIKNYTGEHGSLMSVPENANETALQLRHILTCDTESVRKRLEEDE